MGCCGEKENLEREVQFQRKRSCTDILFFLLFIAALIGSAIIMWRAHELGGSPYAATHGRDYTGDSCGMGQFKTQKYSAWPISPLPSSTVTPEQAQEYYRIKVCVASCDETNQQGNDQFLEPYESVAFWRFCMPKTSIIPDELPTFQSETATRFIADLLVGWPIIAGCAGVAVVIAFIFAKLMSFKAIRVLLVWSMILFILVACAVISWQLIKWAETVETNPLDSFDKAKGARILGWVMAGVTIILFLIVLILRKRINYALRVIGSTSCALSQMRSMFIYPIVPILFLLAFATYWVIVALYIFTVGDETTSPLPVEYDNIPAFAALPAEDKVYTQIIWNTTFQYIFIYHFFLLLWVVQFFSYGAYLTIAGALANWYFSRPRTGGITGKASDRDKERGSGQDQLSYFPITASAWRVIRYHIGTVAFASLIIAIFQFIRAVITYIQEKTKGRDNRLIRCILCCIKCMLYCVQKCVDYVSRQALVVTAINGTNFCSSACTAFGLLTSNIIRVSTFNIIATFITFIGKVFISAVTTCAAWVFMVHYYFTGDRADDLSSPILPLVFIFILSWAIASMFMHLYNVSLECMFICYLADKKGEYTPGKIKKTFEKVEARQKALEDEKHQRLLGNGSSGEANYQNSKQQGSYTQPQQPGGDRYNPYSR